MAKPEDGANAECLFGGMAGSALTLTVMRKAPLRTARCLLLGAVPGKTRRTVVCPAKAGLFSGRQSHRDNNQEPCSLDSREEGNRISEAYRQGLPWGDGESSGCNASERAGGLENVFRGPSPQPEGEGSMDGRKLIDTAGPLRRVVAAARRQGQTEQLEKPSSSRREIAGAG